MKNLSLLDVHRWHKQALTCPGQDGRWRRVDRPKSLNAMISRHSMPLGMNTWQWRSTYSQYFPRAKETSAHVAITYASLDF